MTTTHNIGLQIQLLPSQRQQVFVVAYLVGLQNGDFSFSASEVGSMFDGLRLPRPSNISQSFSSLRSGGLVIKASGNRWYVTPRGRDNVSNVLADIDFQSVEAESALSHNALFDEVPHLTIPPAFAPPRWQPGINRLLARYPFEQNVFCMTRFPDECPGNPDPVANAVAVLRDVLKKHNLVLHVASDRQADDELSGNVGAHIWACHYGIGLLENRAGKGLNFNVVIELGSMLITGRRCAMLKDSTAPTLPSDLSGQIYKSVDFDKPEQVAKAAHLWAANDLGLGRCKECPDDE